jgi:hypothetical protein
MNHANFVGRFLREGAGESDPIIVAGYRFLPDGVGANHFENVVGSHHAGSVARLAVTYEQFAGGRSERRELGGCESRGGCETQGRQSFVDVAKDEAPGRIHI